MNESVAIVVMFALSLSKLCGGIRAARYDSFRSSYCRGAKQEETFYSYSFVQNIGDDAVGESP